MNSPITTLDPVSSPVVSRTVLAENGFTCSLLTLGPGDETPPRESSQVEEHLLFVIEGEATVRLSDINTMLRPDDALLIPKGQAHVIAAGGSGRTRILRVDVPPRRIVTPPIVSFER